MLLTKKLLFKPKENESIILGCLGYASAKLWNVANYEKHNYKTLGFEKFPSWYDQKKRLKDNFWYKNLPSQTAQEVLNKLQKSWESFFVLTKTKGIQNPKPPKFKKKNSKHNFSFLNNGFTLIDNNTVRLSLPKNLKVYLKEKHSIEDNYLSLKINNFSNLDGKVKLIEFKPLNKSKTYQINVVYEVSDTPLKEDNGHYLSIDIGINNLFTCYDNVGKSIIVSGRKLQNINYYYNKKIAHYQSIAYSQQTAEGYKYGRDTKRVRNLYTKKQRQINHFLHSATKTLVSYCVANNITRVVIGDIKNIRDNANLGSVNNQKLHSLPYEKIYFMLTYKLAKEGISLAKQKENYSSQCPPNSIDVSKTYANKNCRKTRGLFVIDKNIYNADSVGAYNILRLYKQTSTKEINTPIKGLSNPYKIKVAV